MIPGGAPRVLTHLFPVFWAVGPPEKRSSNRSSKLAGYPPPEGSRHLPRLRNSLMVKDRPMGQSVRSALHAGGRRFESGTSHQPSQEEG